MKNAAPWGSLLGILVITFLFMQGYLAAADSVELGGDSVSFSKDLLIRGYDLPCRSLQIWGDYYIGTGDIDPKGAKENLSFENDFSGAQIGVNVGLGSAFLATCYYNYQQYDFSAAYSGINPSSYSNGAKTHAGGLGLRFNTSGFYFSLIGNYGLDEYKLTPSFQEGNLDYDGWQTGGSFETGYMMPTGGFFTLKPFGNWQYSYLKCDGIDYNSFTYKDDKFTADALFQTLGARIDMELGLFTLQGRLGWVHQYLGASPINNYWFSRTAGTYTPTQCFFEGSSGSDYFWGGAGVKISLFGMMAATLDYDVLLNRYQTTHTGSVGLLWSF